MEDNQFNSLTFWRNWYNAARPLPDDLRLAWLDAVLDFAFTGKEPKPPEDGASIEDGILIAIGYQAVQMVRATIEISRKRKQSGSKGGATHKQTASKSQANDKQKRKPRKQVKEQVQEQEQEQEHIAISSAATREQQPTLDQFLAGAVLAGVPEDFARDFHAGLVAAGWRDADGLYVANWRRYLKSAWVDEQKKISAARAESSASDELMKGLRRARA